MLKAKVWQTLRKFQTTTSQPFVHLVHQVNQKPHMEKKKKMKSEQRRKKIASLSVKIKGYCTTVGTKVVIFCNAGMKIYSFHFPLLFLKYRESETTPVPLPFQVTVTIYMVLLVMCIQGQGQVSCKQTGTIFHISQHNTIGFFLSTGRSLSFIP